jgi:hypothetical protein
MMKTSHPQLALALALLMVASSSACQRKAEPEILSVALARAVTHMAAPRKAQFTLAGKRVLLVGDSMAAGLQPSMQQRVEAAGGLFFAEPWQSSTIIGWDGTGRLREMLERYQPDIVFISLGSNELEARRPEQRAPLIRRMVEAIGPRPAYWIGPPSWKPDKGLLRVIEENFQPTHFYNASNLNVPRQRDGKHPTLDGFSEWTRLIWNWYEEKQGMRDEG